MKSLWIALVVCVLLLTAAVLHMAWYYPALPDRMASHFNLHGVADGFAPKAAFVRVSAAVIFGISGLLVAVGLLMQCVPASIVNLPNKDYWLSPSESRRTRNWATAYLFWMADATVLFFMAMNQAIFQANLVGAPRLDFLFGVSLGLYCAFVVAWCLMPYLRFRKPRETDTA